MKSSSSSDSSEGFFLSGKLATVFFLIVCCFANSMDAQKPEHPQGASHGNASATQAPSLLSKHYYKPDASTMNLHGKVKSVYQITFMAIEKNGSIIKTDTSGQPTLTLFDEEGNITSILFYQNNGSVADAYEMNYVRLGMVSEKKSYLYSRYRLSEKNVYKYNEDDYLISNTTYDSTGAVTNKFIYSYLINYRDNNYSMKTDSFYYRDWGTHNLVGASTTDYDDFVLDKDTNIISKESKSLSNYKLMTYGYNAERQKVSEIYQDNSKHDESRQFDILYTLKYEYDVNGNVVHEISTGDATPRTFKYTYDSKGNWIKQVINNNGNDDPSFNKDDQYRINERKIVYY